MADPVSLSEMVRWPNFPFSGDLRLRTLKPFLTEDWARAGEPGGPRCPCETKTDVDYLWVDDNWRVAAEIAPKAVPLFFLETREHLDLGDMSAELAADLGQMIVRLDRAITSIGGIGRVHSHRWGDGGSHFHMWFYGRPVGAFQLAGWSMSVWADLLPPMPQTTWDDQRKVVADALVAHGGRSVL